MGPSGPAVSKKFPPGRCPGTGKAPVGRTTEPYGAMECEG